MKKGLMDVIVLLLAASYLISVFIIPPSWWNDQLFTSGDKTIEVTVPSGYSAKEICLLFEEAGLISNSDRLAYWMQEYNIDRKIQPGRYVLKRGSAWEVARQMMETKPSRDRMTIIPGSDFTSVNKLFENREDLLSALDRNSNFPSALMQFIPDNAKKRVTFMLPDTYFLPELEPDLLVRRSSGEWWKRVGKEIKDKGKLEEIERLSIIASLIEKEAQYDDERNTIAGVIFNRLKKGMPLQIDASIIYAWKNRGEVLKRVLYKHLTIESPYNTYKNTGLPPGPICIPSYESWLGALDPENHAFFYYVADANGRHIFSKTYEEHKEAIKKARQNSDQN